MIVMKFGGTSVGDARAIRQVVQIVQQQVERRPVVVVSAHAGVTDALLRIADTAPGGAADTSAIAERHRSILRELGLPADLLDPLLAELSDLARGLRLVGAASAKDRDLLASFGERCSARTVAAALRQAGLAAAAVDAFAAGLLTDSAFGNARPLPDDGRIAAHLARVDGVPVVTGFLGADQLGNITTLGRNGSDYSAALFGAAVAATEIQIWKDVDGVRTADPRLVPGALPIREMTYAEACELASFGAKVLHPAAMVPAMQRGIAIQVRSTLQPAAPGTTIRDGVPPAPAAIRAIAHRAPVTLMSVTSQRLVPQHRFLVRVFGALATARCDVSPIAVGESAVTFAVDEARAAEVANCLDRLGPVTYRNAHAVVGIVGDRDALERGGAARVFTGLAGAGIVVRCAAHGALGSTLAFAVELSDLPRAVALLHEQVFGV